MNEVLDFSLKSIWMERWETIRTLSLWLRLAGYVMERFFTLNGMVEGTKTRFHLFYSCVWNEHRLTSQWEFCLSKRQLHFTKNCCRLCASLPWGSPWLSSVRFSDTHLTQNWLIKRCPIDRMNKWTSDFETPCKLYKVGYYFFFPFSMTFYIYIERETERYT